ncbi:nucleolar and coiled-body phosphoprotein 1-like [Anneissia japonica]|uniref:nucleolar and coiled-body phosphoprotein 1-like n=1 Tax=Anneissia japonica TaxID=1529436 RepID=UPI001425A0E1|nr:nucleolar and coiled-body phosphoprotein 1-like [Anneissia japonica]
MGKSKKSQSKDPVLVEEEEVTVGPETFHKSLEELKKALNILGFEITPKKKPSTEKIASPIADVINESRKRKVSTGSNTEAESSEPHPKRHKHGKHRHHKHKEKGDGSETKLPATITSPEAENSIERVAPFCSTPVSSGAKSAKRAVLEGAPLSATMASSQSSESDQFSLVKMSPLNNSKYLKKHKKDSEFEELPITSKKSPKKKQKTKNYNEQTTQPNSKPASKEKISQKSDSQSGLGGDWTRQEIASGDAKKLALLEKYFSGEKGAKKQEIKETKGEKKSAGKPSPSNKQNVIEKSNQLIGNTSELHIGKDIIKASTSGYKVNKPLMKSICYNSSEAHTTLSHKSPAKKLKMDTTSVLIATKTQKLKNTKCPPDSKTVKEHSAPDSQQVSLEQETVTEKRKRAKKQKKEDTTAAFVGTNKSLDISKDKGTSDDSQSSSSTNDSQELKSSEISSKKKKKKKHTKKSKKREKKNKKETSKSKKVKSTKPGIVNTQPISFPAKSSILLSESKKTKKPNDKVKTVASSTFNSPQKERSLSSITPEIKQVVKVNKVKKHRVKSKNENISQAEKEKKSLSLQDISQVTNQMESKPPEKKSKKKQKTIENTKTNNSQVINIDVMKKTSTAKMDGKSVKNCLTGNLKSSEIKKSKAPQKNTLSKDSKTAKETLTSPLTKTQEISNVKGNVKSKKPVGDDELFSKSFDFDAWEEKMKMIELLKSGGKLEKNESEEKVPTPSFEDSAPASRDKKKKKKKTKH